MKISQTSEQKESEIQRSILDFLDRIGIWAWKNFNGPELHHGIMFPTKIPGSPDIMGIMPGGRAIHIEVKTPKGIKEKSRIIEKKTKRGYIRGPNRIMLQREWIDRAAKMGAVAIMASSVHDVYEHLINIGFMRRPWVEQSGEYFDTSGAKKPT